MATKTKKEEVIDFTKPTVVTKEQLQKIQDTVNNLNRAQLDIGMMEIKKHEMTHKVAGLRDELVLLQSELEKEYGTFDVDIQSGTINYPKENGKADS